MQLTAAQKESLYRDGFVLLPGAVSRLLVEEALYEIHRSLGENGMHPDELVKFRSQTYCPEVTRLSAITDLYHASPLQSLCESALGEGNIHPVLGAQIALRFPRERSRTRLERPHLDGTYSPHNGVKPGQYANFTALLGVFLSDVPTTAMGNFTVWPGSHRAYQEYFQQHGADKYLEGTPQIELAPPRQLTARAGDAVLCHFQLGHGVAPNFSPYIRYATFFRLKHRDHDSHAPEVLCDIWRDWPGMRSVVEAAETIEV